jgi:hypothetical protein
MLLPDLLSAFSFKSRYRRARRRLTGCCLSIILGLLLACAAFFGLSYYLTHHAGAQGPSPKPLEVMLLIDNSNSMWEKGGMGSDPDLLRIEAARLFITYLGVDSRGPAQRLGVIFFGDEAQLVVPLTPLADEMRRTDMLRLIADPPRMGWTDPLAALHLAGETLGASAAARAVVLLTDGKPEWSTAPTAQEQAETIARLRDMAGRLAVQEVPLFIVLLQNEATDADAEIEGVFVPLWQEMAGATPGGRFYRARAAEDLLDVYHDIVVSLTGRKTAGVVVQTQVQTATLKHISVEAGLAQVTFVVRKSDPALKVAILRPDGRVLRPDVPGVQHGGRPGQSREEVWAVDAPEPGQWQVRIDGRGAVTVWKDYYPAPATPTPSPTPSPAPSPTPRPSPTARPTATARPLPTLGPLPRLRLSEPAAPTGVRPGDSLPVVATWLPGARVLAYLEAAGGIQVDQTSLAESGQGRYTAELSLPAPGRYRLRVEGEATLPNGLIVQDEASRPVLGRALWWSRAWAWLGLPVVALGAGGYLWQRRRNMPLLEGVLRRLAAAANSTVPVRLDLDARHCRAISLGPDPAADVHLPHAPESPTPRARLVAQRTAGGGTNVVLTAEAAAENSEVVLVNGLPLSHEHWLRDGDSIQLGAYRFRYENLRRRAPDQWRGHTEDE